VKTTVGKIFAVIVVLVTVVTTYCVVTRAWWMPVNISTHGARIDHQKQLRVDTQTGYISRLVVPTWEDVLRCGNSYCH
jgi:hypothetical protein